MLYFLKNLFKGINQIKVLGVYATLKITFNFEEVDAQLFFVFP